MTHTQDVFHFDNNYIEYILNCNSSSMKSDLDQAYKCIYVISNLI